MADLVPKLAVLDARGQPLGVGSLLNSQWTLQPSGAFSNSDHHQMTAISDGTPALLQLLIGNRSISARLALPGQHYEVGEMIRIEPGDVIVDVPGLSER